MKTRYIGRKYFGYPKLTQEGDIFLLGSVFDRLLIFIEKVDLFPQIGENIVYLMIQVEAHHWR